MADIKKVRVNNIDYDIVDAKAAHIEIVDSLPETVGESELRTLYRDADYDDADQETIDNIQVVDKITSSGGQFDCDAIPTRNNTQINTEAQLRAAFDENFNKVFGDSCTIDAIDDIYTAYYNISDTETKAIRVKDNGELEINNCKHPALKIIAGNYFSYNGQTGEKYYDSATLIVNGVSYALSNEPTIITIGEAATYDISSTNRSFIYGFSAETLPETRFVIKKLIQENTIDEINTKLNSIQTQVTANKGNITINTNAIRVLNADLQETKAKIGDIQIFNANYLPRASINYINKILRVNGKLYQVKANGIEKEYSFAGVSGTSQITDNNWADFARDVGNGFANDFSSSGPSRLYRNNGDIRIGSSSDNGAFSLLLNNPELPSITRVVLKLNHGLEVKLDIYMLKCILSLVFLIMSIAI